MAEVNIISYTLLNPTLPIYYFNISNKIISDISYIVFGVLGHPNPVCT